MTAKLQKVVVGMDVDKLDPKEFVQVKDGEVVGFVENQIHQKLENKSKIETKDAFGNKKITEVPLEVIYGDSLVFHANDNAIRSVVTLQHDKRNCTQRLQVILFIIVM